MLNLSLFTFADDFSLGIDEAEEALLQEMQAQNYNHESQVRNLVVSYEVEPYDTDLLGDSYDKVNGTVKVEHVDVSLPGNFSLPVEIRRSYNISSSEAQWGHRINKRYEIGGWRLENPRITFDIPDIEEVPEEDRTLRMHRGGMPEGFEMAVQKQCSGDIRFKTIMGHPLGRGPNVFASPEAYGSAPQLHIPGQSQQKFLLTKDVNEGIVGINKQYYPFVTKNKWRISCITQKDGVGEGFVAESPQGEKYTFDIMVNKGSLPNVSSVEPVTRMETIEFLVSKVEDKWGNWVKYEYKHYPAYEYESSSAYTPNRTVVVNEVYKIIRIHSSDKREIVIGYDQDNPNNIDFVTAGSRTWSYEYESVRLQEVVLPDGRNWAFDLQKDAAFEYWDDSSASRLKETLEFRTLHHNRTETIPDSTIKHPDGTLGTFEFKYTEQCDVSVDINPGNSFVDYRMIVGRACSFMPSLTAKTLSGPGMENQTWSYTYSQNSGNYLDPAGNNYPYDDSRMKYVVTDGSRWPTYLSFFTSSSNARFRSYDIASFKLHDADLPSNIDDYNYRSVKVQHPSGKHTKFFINRNRLSLDEYGKVIARQLYNSNNIKIEEVQYEYTEGTAFGRYFVPSTEMKHMGAQTQKLLSKKVIREYNNTTDTYTTEYSNFDVYDVARNTKQYNSVNQRARYINQNYQYDTDAWIINLPTTTYLKDNSSSYVEAKRIEYYPSNYADYANSPKEISYFGSWVKKFASYSDEGNVNRIEFNAPLIKGKGNRYQALSNYYRGIPRQIDIPARYKRKTEISATRTVDYFGAVTSVTDYNSNTTSYNYDDVGRILSADMPGDDWLDSLFTWSYDGGIAGNQPVRKVKRCKLNTARDSCIGTPALIETSTYDTRLRALEVVTTDVDNNISVYKNASFNTDNQPTFQSYPSYSAGESEGTHFTYDGLQRQLSIAQDNGGTVTQEYIAGNAKKVTDAKNNITTTTFLAYGSPSYGQATRIASPENVTTDIEVNLFGDIESITQSGADGNNQTEYRAYNRQHQLCQIKRNDVGATVISRRVNGEINWQAQGQTAASNTVCNTTAPTNSKVSFIYDSLGSERYIRYGDNAPTRTFTRDHNGNIKSIIGEGFSQSYNYNSLNLLEDETLSIAGRAGSLTLDYNYNSLSNLSSLKYPDGSKPVKFAPNAFGQPTKAMRHYSDKDPDVFVYGNGTASDDIRKARYHPNGSIKKFVYGNGIVHLTRLNLRQIPRQITDQLGSTDIVNLSYTYDDNNNIKSLINTRDSGLYSLTDLTYDGLDRLLSTTGGNGIGSSEITYDGLGNIKTYSNDSVFNPSDLTYSYKTNLLLNDVKTTGTNTKIRDFSSSNSYDARGNVKSNGNSKGVNTFNYNLANQMTSAGGNSYVYDGYNRRVKTKDSKGTSYSFYSQAGKLLYRETSQGGGINYIYLGNKLVAKEGTGVVSSGDSIMNYKPFGESIEAPKDDVGYTGHKFDTDLGLSYMQARYYDPVIGRFYSNDPVGYTAKNPVMSFNRYMYVNNNPYKYTDPNGEFLFVGFAIGFVADAAIQYATTGKVDVQQSLISGAVGAVTGGLTSLAKSGLTVGAKVVATQTEKIAAGGLVASGSAVAGAGGHAINESLNGNTPTLGDTATSGLMSATGPGKQVGGAIGKVAEFAKDTFSSLDNKAADLATQVTSDVAGKAVDTQLKKED